MADCDWEPLARKLAWKRLLFMLRGKVLKKAAKGVGGGAIMAAIDGPIPVGDVIGLLYALWKIADACIGFWDLWDAYWFIRDDVLRRTRELLEKTASRKGVSLDDMLKDPRCCRCIKNFLNALIDVATSQGKKRFRKTVVKETKTLVRCLAQC